jgi:hypothetical protein
MTLVLVASALFASTPTLQGWRSSLAKKALSKAFIQILDQGSWFTFGKLDDNAHDILTADGVRILLTALLCIAPAGLVAGHTLHELGRAQPQLYSPRS